MELCRWLYLEHAEDAELLAKALIDGGLPCAEVTFRTAAAKDSITRIAKKYPEMLLGAGTGTFRRTGESRKRRRCKIYCQPWVES